MNVYENVDFSDKMKELDENEYLIYFKNVEKIFKSGRILNHALDNVRTPFLLGR